MKKSDQQITILIPGLFEGLNRWPENQSEHDIAPGLLFLLAKASKYCHSCNGLERTILKCFCSKLAADEELPIALLRSGGRSQPVICADPVSLQLGVSEIELIHGGELELNEADIVELSQYLNGFFTQESMRWTLDSNGYGLLALEKFPVLSTTPLSGVSGEILTGKLPQGRDQATWHRLGNEVQMLLHDCAFNKRRESEGNLPINTLWFWGCGQKQPLFDVHYDAVFANDGLSELLAKQINNPLAAVPDSYLSLAVANRESGHSLVVLESLWDPCQSNDYLGWRQQLQEYDNLWFQPLLEGMNGHQFTSVTIRTTTGDIYLYHPRHRFRFWRRQRSLQQCHSGNS